MMQPRIRTAQHTLVTRIMYSTRGIEAVATITELRSSTAELLEHAKTIERGILIQKNNEPYAVLVSYDVYEKLMSAAPAPKRKRAPRKAT